MEKEAVKSGYWVRAKESKRLWAQVVLDRKRAAAKIEASLDSGPESCKCQYEYDLENCVLETYPLSKVCRMELYEQVKERLGEVESDSFDDLSARHKRWCVYWFYSVNVLFGNNKKKIRRKLPDCFVEYVRGYYPEPAGETYTGFKEKGSI